MVRLPYNCGPAGGFKIGLLEAFREPNVRWAYLCEDDVGLFDLPSPRLFDLLDRVRAATGVGGPGSEPANPVGAVVAYGRVFVGSGCPHRERRPGRARLTGSRRSTSPAGVRPWCRGRWSTPACSPMPTWFFGLEDFDFFCRVRDAGFDVLLDEVAARRVAEQQTNAGRESRTP